VSDLEAAFREVEGRLDDVLRRDAAVIAAHGVSIADDSARTYHYKNAYLVWSHRFESRRARETDIQKVAVAVTLVEGDVATVTIRRRAEIFQLGKLSRWENTVENRRPLEEILSEGLAAVVLQAIRAGEEAAARVT